MDTNKHVVNQEKETPAEIADADNPFLRLRDQAAQQKATEENRLSQAIWEARKNGKEDFNFDRLAKDYWRQSIVEGDLSQISDNAKAALMRRYYLDCPEIKTMDDFINYLEHYDTEVGL